MGTDKASEGSARPEDVERLAEKYMPAWESGDSADDPPSHEPPTSPAAPAKPVAPNQARPSGGPIEPFALAPPDDPPPRSVPARAPAATAAPAQAIPRASSPEAADAAPATAKADTAPPGIFGAAAGGAPRSAPPAPAVLPAPTAPGVSSTAPGGGTPSVRTKAADAASPPSGRKAGRSGPTRPASASDFALSVPPTPLQPPVQPTASQLPTVMIAEAAFPEPVKDETKDEAVTLVPPPIRKRKVAFVAMGVAAAAILAVLLLRPGASREENTSPHIAPPTPTAGPARVPAAAAVTGAPQTVGAAPSAAPDELPPVAEPAVPARGGDHRPSVSPAAAEIGTDSNKPAEPASDTARTTTPTTRKTTTHKAPQPAKPGAIVRDVPF